MCEILPLIKPQRISHCPLKPSHTGYGQQKSFKKNCSLIFSLSLWRQKTHACLDGKKRIFCIVLLAFNKKGYTKVDLFSKYLPFSHLDDTHCTVSYRRANNQTDKPIYEVSKRKDNAPFPYTIESHRSINCSSWHSGCAFSDSVFNDKGGVVCVGKSV